MLVKETETYVVVISCLPSAKGFYKVKLADAEGETYEMVLHEQLIVDYRLIVGKELDKKTFSALLDSEGYQKAYSYATGIIARRMYTEKEIRRKLYERETADDVISDVVAKLFEIGLIDDAVYAQAYIEDQIGIGKKSKRQIISDLYAKGVSENIINDSEGLFNDMSESELIVKEIEKLHSRYSRKDLGDFELRKRVVQALGRKGFEIGVIQRQYDFFIEDLAVDDD